MVVIGLLYLAKGGITGLLLVAGVVLLLAHHGNAGLLATGIGLLAGAISLACWHPAR